MDSNNSVKAFLNSYDSLTKNLSQAQGAMVAVTGNDQYRHISDEALSSVLWLILDQIGKALEDAHDCRQFWDKALEDAHDCRQFWDDELKKPGGSQ